MKNFSISGLDQYQTSIKNHKKKIIDYLKLFVNEEHVILAAELINPFGVSKIDQNYPEEIKEYLNIYNKFQENKPSYLRVMDDQVLIHAKLIFLANLKCLFESDDDYIQNRFDEILSKEKISYAINVLETLNNSKLHQDLEDQFFNFLAPVLFSKYERLRSETFENYNKKKDKIFRDFENLLMNETVKGEVKVRLKTIYSIYKKIVRKNILYSLVLDVIGVRIVLDDEIDCYKVMLAILQKWQVLNNKIKDYIAVPKDNGYQSIHLTVLHMGEPVEIQIRTRSMEHHAKYGIASHTLYKKQESPFIHKL